MNRRTSSLGAGALLLLATVMTASCRQARTEIVLRVNTDMSQGPGATLTSVRVRVQRGTTTATFNRTFVIDGTASGPYLPADMGIVPFENDTSRPITVSVTALQGMTELFTHQSTVTFERERTTQLDVFLSDRCRDPVAQMCPSGTTCGATGCEPIARSPLPTFAGSDAQAPRPDASNPPDSSTPIDASTDAVEDTGVEPLDTGVSLDSGVAMDTGVPPIDSGVRVDTGVAPIDTGVAPMDSGTITVTSCGPVAFGPTGGPALIAEPGMNTLNTDTGLFTTASTSTLMLTVTNVPQAAGAPSIAVFQLASVNVPMGATLRITGARVAALLSATSILVDGIIDASGGTGGSGSPNTPGSPGSGFAGGFAGGMITGGCAGGLGSGAGPGRGGVGACGGTGGRGGDASGASAGGGGGGGGCGGGGGAGGSFATPGGEGATGSAPTSGSGLVGAGTGGGSSGTGCTGDTPGGAVMPPIFDSALMPIFGGSGGGGGGFGGFQGFGGRGGGSGAGGGGAGGFSGGGGGGGAGGGAVVLCTGATVRIAGQIRVNGGLGGAASGPGVAMTGSNASVTGSTAAGGGGGAGASGAGGGGGGGAGGSIYIQAPAVVFTGTLDANGGIGGSGFSVNSSGAFGGTGRMGGGSGGRGGGNGIGGRGGDGGRGGLRVVSPMFNNAGVVRGMLRHDLM